MNSDLWTDRLSEYLDSELDPQERIAMEAHLADCAACRQTLRELRSVVRALGADPADTPDAALWGRIEARLEPRTEVREAPVRPGSAARRRPAFSLRAAGLAAAAVLVLALGGRALWRAPASPVPPASPPRSAPAYVLPAAARPTPPEAHAIADLQRILDEGRGHLAPETLRRIQESLALVDTAIAQAERAIAADTSNPYVARQLERLRREKLETLREASGIVLSRT